MDDSTKFLVCFFLSIPIIIVSLYIHWRDMDSPPETQQERFEREWKETHEERNRLIRQYVASDDLLSQTKDILFSYEGEAAEICERIINEVNTKKPSYDMIELALLAQKCKVPEDIAKNGFISNGDFWNPKDYVEARFLRWYDNELRSHGFPYKLKYIQWTELHGGRMCTNLNVATDISEHLPTDCCCYFWEPQRFKLYGRQLRMEPVYWLCSDNYFKI